MTAANLDSLLRLVRKLADEEATRALSDGELLERYRTGREEAAFALLLQRHGPLVLGVCRRLLGNVPDAEDAFQATFLALVRQAGSIRNSASLGAWLHGVARRIALKARARAGQRRTHESERRSPAMTNPDPGAEMTWEELRTVIDEEVGRLPEECRAAVVACLLEGRTQEQAARELGWPKSTLAGRLDRGRDLLRQGLTRRGITLSAAGLAALLGGKGAVAMPATLFLSTVRAAASPAEASPKVAALAEGAGRGLTWGRWKIGAALLAGCVFLGGMVTLVCLALASDPAEIPGRGGGGNTTTNPGNGDGLPPAEAPDVDRLLQQVIAGKLGRRNFLLEISFGGKVPAEQGAVRIFGSGTGERNFDKGLGPVNGAGMGKAFTLSRQQVSALLKRLRTFRPGAFPGRLGKYQDFNTSFLEMSVQVTNVRKHILLYVPAGRSIYQPALGPEADRLVELARAVRRDALQAAPVPAMPDSLENGLDNIVRKKLALEHLVIGLHHRQPLPAVKDGGGRGRGKAGEKIAPPAKGWMMSIQGPFVRTQRWSTLAREPNEYFVLVLTRQEVRDLAQFLLDNRADDLPAHLERNDRRGQPFAPSTDFQVIILQHKINLTDGDAVRLDPKGRLQFQRVYDRLHRLHRRALREGRVWKIY
jgi:RNA polymerase sigma factor (sigma-70 family)